MRKILIIFLVLLGSFHVNVQASQIENPEVDQQAIEEKIIKEFDFDDIDHVLREIMPGERLKFGETVRKLINGEVELSVSLLGRLISDQIFYEFNHSREGLVHILLIAVIAAIFTNFSNIFRSQQIGEISFYVLYLLLITICLASFQIVLDSVGERMRLLIAFMRALGPAYFLSVAIATGSGTSIAFYNLVLFLIYIVELLILNFLLPLLHIYIVVRMLNHLSTEDYLSKFAELIEFVIVWTLKTLLAAVIGLNLIQGMIAPAIDSIKRSMLTKGVEALPGVGDALGGVTKVVLGTAVLVKNGIGVAGAVICIAICAVPAVQVLVMTFLYKLIAAFIQPISDKRIVGCVTSMGDASQILLRLVFTTGVLFLLTIAIVTAATTG